MVNGEGRTLSSSDTCLCFALRCLTEINLLQFNIYLLFYVSKSVSSMFLKIVARSESRYCWGTLR